MFAQVITGRTNDKAALKKALDDWEDKLRPGAKGFLGSTGGVADDGTFIAVARFESADAARANSDRPEQGEWWSRLEKHLSDVSFADSSDVATFAGGGSDDAGFVQVMRGRSPDRAALEKFDGDTMDAFLKWRPDFLGGVRVWEGDGRYTEIAYFRSEAEAREGEKKEPPAELVPMMADFQRLTGIEQYIDLKDPWTR